MEQQLPEDYSVTITIRLALAEAVDEAGDPAQALIEHDYTISIERWHIVAL